MVGLLALRVLPKTAGLPHSLRYHFDSPSHRHVALAPSAHSPGKTLRTNPPDL